MVSNTTDKQGAIELLEKAIEVIAEIVEKEEGGALSVKMKPKAVSETDDLELAALMDRVARENKEVSGTSPRSRFGIPVADLLRLFVSSNRGRGFRRRMICASCSGCSSQK